MLAERGITCVLPTQNRAAYLPRVLDSFSLQTLPSELFEVVIVDDGSSDNTSAIVDEYRSKMSNITYIRQENRGISAANNAALDIVRSPFVVFVDDDDVADRSLLSEHLKGHHTYDAPNVTILGLTNIDQTMSSDPLMHFVTQVGCQLFSYNSLSPSVQYGYKELWGGRTSRKTSILDSMRFNELFRFGCEDIELGWRLRARDLSVRYWPAASTTMIRLISLQEFCLRSYRQGKAQSLFSSVYPSEAEVTAFCQTGSLEPMNRAISLDLKTLYRRTENLHNAALLSFEHSGKIDETLSANLHGAYDVLFKQCKQSGIINKDLNLS